MNLAGAKAKLRSVVHGAAKPLTDVPVHPTAEHVAPPAQSVPPARSARPPAAQPTGASSAPKVPSGWTAELRRARWREGARYEIAGWAYVTKNAAMSAPDASIRVYLQDAAGARRIAATTRVVSAEVNASASSATHDWSGAAFEAIVDFRPLLDSAPTGAFTRQWSVLVELGDGPSELVNRFIRRDASGSAGALTAEAFGDDLHVRPVWSDDSGLRFDLTRRVAVADELALSGRTLSGSVHWNGSFAATALMLEDSSTKTQLSAPLRAMGGNVGTFTIDLPPGSAASTRTTRSYVFVTDDAGARRYVHWAAGRGREIGDGTSDCLVVRHAAAGVVRVEERRADAIVEEVEVLTGAGEHRQPAVRIAGRWHGPTGEVSAELRGPRQTVAATSTTIADGRFEAVVPLLVDDGWGNSGLAPHDGSYRLWAKFDDPRPVQVPMRVAPSFAETLPRSVFGELVNLRVERDDQDHLAVDLRGPMPENEIGPYPYRQLSNAYAARVAVDGSTDGQPVELAEAVYFESAAGRTATDNTLAVHDEVARRRPHLKRYWAVDSRSVAIPDGAIPIIYHSAEWFDVLATSRYVVTNYWLPGAFVRRPGQVVLQTWHGTPLKLLGNDRPVHQKKPGYRARTLRDVEQWSFLMSQNEHSTATFRNAYGYTGEVLEVGYPRDDVLVGERGRQQAVVARQRLGISPQEKVILYAPTFRDDADEMVRYLDHGAVVAAMGPGTTLLMRGHTYTIKQGGNLAGRGILDVTTYPQIADLYLAADVCITDYSSVMFDFTITGKPILFFVPDHDEYRDAVRGMYFDLGEISPGPMLVTTEQVIAALTSLPTVTAEYAQRYAAWQAKFNAWDDGQAARKAVDALFRAD